MPRTPSSTGQRCDSVSRVALYSVRPGDRQKKWALTLRRACISLTTWPERRPHITLKMVGDGSVICMHRGQCQEWTGLQKSLPGDRQYRQKAAGLSSSGLSPGMLPQEARLGEWIAEPPFCILVLPFCSSSWEKSIGRVGSCCLPRFKGPNGLP